MKAVPSEIDWHEDLSIYASRSFLESVSDECGWLGGHDRLDRLRCILPYTIIRKAGLRMVRFRLETIYLDDEVTTAEEKAFLNAAVAYFRSIGADIIIPASTNTIFRTYPDRAVAAPYGSYVIALEESEDELWANLHSKHRNVVRSAQKKGVEVSLGLEYTDYAYDLIRDTFKRSRLSFMDRKSFDRMMAGLGDYVRVFVAKSGGSIQGCAIIPFSNNTAYYAYGGTIEQPVTGATNLLQWEAIRYFRQRGVKRYDFCGVRIEPDKGSKAATLKLYKERFGPRLRRGYMWKQALNPLKAPVYSCGVRLLRGGDIVDRERHKLAAFETSLGDANA